MALRTAVSNYDIEGLEPRLRLCESPKGALQWQGPDPRSLEDIRHMEILGEGPDEGFINWLEELGGIV